MIAIVGTALRYLLRRDPLEVGDGLVPDYAHFFAEEEIRRELQQAGFELVFHDTQGYGHAAGIARTEWSEDEGASAGQDRCPCGTA